MAEITEEKSAPAREPDRPRRLTPPPRPRSSRRGWLVAVIIVVLIAIVLGGIFAYLRYMRGSSVTYVQQAVRTGNLQITVAATGQLQPKAVYDMNFSGAGQIQAIDVQIGQQVTAGQTLATLNKGAPMTAPANATVAAINGVVGENVGSNGNVSAGSSGSSGGSNGGGSSQPFMILTDTSSFTISAQVNEADIEQIKSGQNAQFTLPAFPNKTFTASVTDIQTYGQTSSSVVNYTVDLAVNNSSLQGTQPYPGMTATINIITQQVTNALLVPNSALTFPSQALQSGELSRAALRSLYRSQGGLNGNSTNGSSSTSSQGKRGTVLELQNGQLTPVVVTTGLTNGQDTQILSGLNQGDRVVTSQVGGTGTTGILNSLGGGRGGLGGNGGAGRGGAGGAGGGRRNGGGGTSNGG